MLRVNSVTKIYKGSTKALDDISFSVSRGTCTSIIGKNGSGKSTLIGILARTIEPNAGEIYIDNVIATRESSRLIGTVPQEIHLNGYEKVLDVLITQAAYFDIDWSTATRRGEEFCSLLELKPNALVRKLSGGAKRKLTIARGLIHNPSLLLLDEPTVGVDIAMKERIWDYFRNEMQQRQLTILLTSHNDTDIDTLASSVLLISTGKIVAAGDIETIKGTYLKSIYTFTVRPAKPSSNLLPPWKILSDTEITLNVPLGTEIGSYLEHLQKVGYSIVDITQEHPPITSLIKHI